MENQHKQQPAPVLDYQPPLKGPEESASSLGGPSIYFWVLATLAGALALLTLRIGLYQVTIPVALAAIAGTHFGLVLGVAGAIWDSRRRAATVGTSLNGVYCLLFWMVALSLRG